MFMTRDMLRIMGQENLICLSRPTLFFFVFLFEPTPSTCYTYTAFAFSLYTGRDIDRDDSHALIMCVAQPLSGSSANESCAQDTEQMHGKHGSGALLNPVFRLFLLC